MRMRWERGRVPCERPNEADQLIFNGRVHHEVDVDVGVGDEKAEVVGGKMKTFFCQKLLKRFIAPTQSLTFDRSHFESINALIKQ